PVVVFVVAAPSFVRSLLPRPPRPPLFPYTTLFRSWGRRLPGVGRGAIGRPGLSAAGGRADPVHPAAGCAVSAMGPRRASPPGGQDRKSTRLNSSHVSISYAVFCLKKKKKQGDMRAV